MRNQQRDDETPEVKLANSLCRLLDSSDGATGSGPSPADDAMRRPGVDGFRRRRPTAAETLCRSSAARIGLGFRYHPDRTGTTLTPLRRDAKAVGSPMAKHVTGSQLAGKTQSPS